MFAKVTKSITSLYRVHLRVLSHAVYTNNYYRTLCIVLQTGTLDSTTADLQSAQ